MKNIVFAVIAGIFLVPQIAKATGITLSTSLVTTEVEGSTAVFVSIPYDPPEDITVVFCIFSGLQCATILDVLSFPNENSPSPLVAAWDGLWTVSPTDGFQGRVNGTYAAQVIIGTSSFVSPPITFDSLDLHGFTMRPVITDQGKAAFPVQIRYSIAKDANVYTEIKDSGNNIVYSSTATALTALDSNGRELVISNTWNGRANQGSGLGEIVPIGIYQVSLTPTSGSARGITRTKSISIGSPGGSSNEALKSSIKAYPNPVRSSQDVTILFSTIRDGATTNLKVYTLNGDLVFEKKAITDGYVWPVTNQSGKRVGRGLYYLVLFQESGDGNVHATTKVAVIE